jgi:hypothetical protein
MIPAMARIQQKSAGSRIKREPLDAAELRHALKSCLASRGLQTPRFGEMNLRRPKPSKPE